MDVQTQKTYVTSKKKWTNFNLHRQLIQVLKMNNMTKPTRVQDETLEITTNIEKKKYNLLIRSSNGSGKTLCYLLPILNSLKVGQTITKDKVIYGKTYKDEIFTPQAIIFVQTGMLAQQIQLILQQFQKTAENLSELQNKKLEILNFTIGMMNGDIHKPGDIIISVIKSFINRNQRRNISLQNCNFVAFDEVDQIYEAGPQFLEKTLQIVQIISNIKLLVCSATMKKQFLDFYNKNISKSKQCLQININHILKNELGYNISLEGVTNYIYVSKKQTPQQRHHYIINEIFKYLYQNTQKIKPKVFIFFNSIIEIQKFKEVFDNFVNQQNQKYEYLKGIRLGIVAAKRRQNGVQKDLSHQQRFQTLNKFRNGDFHILLATNIIARGIDIRDVCFVINCDAPRQKNESNSTISLDTYLHRVGRTGRYSDKGIALTIVPFEKDRKFLIENIEKVHKIAIKNLVSIQILHQQIIKCISFNTNTNIEEDQQ